MTYSLAQTNPILLEHIIATDPRVKGVIVFGNGRSQIGVLLQLHDEFHIDSTNPERMEAFRKYIQ